MLLSTASTRAEGDDGRCEVVQMELAAYDRDHAFTLRHNHRTRWRQQLPMYELIQASVIERPESCALTPANARFANIHKRNYYGAYPDSSLYRSTVSRVAPTGSVSGRRC